MAEGRPEKIIFDLPAKIDSRFASAFDTRLVEATTSSWNFWFGLLEKYFEDQGDVDVSHNYVTENGFKPGIWASNKRVIKDILSPVASRSSPRRHPVRSIVYTFDENTGDWL